MEYGEVLNYYLVKLDMKPAELARRIDSPRSTVDAWLKGHAREPKLSTAKEVADALGVPLEEMVEMMYGDDQEGGGQ